MLSLPFTFVDVHRSSRRSRTRARLSTGYGALRITRALISPLKRGDFSTQAALKGHGVVVAAAVAVASAMATTVTGIKTAGLTGERLVIPSNNGGN
jgi:hypothetical protein